MRFATKLPDESFLTGLSPSEILTYLEDLLRLAEKPLERTGTIKYISPEQVIDKCLQGEWQCWIAHNGIEIEAAFFTYITVHASGYKSFVVDLVGGNNIDRWLVSAWGLFKDFARANDCQEINGGGRKGWIRKLGIMDKVQHEMRFIVEIDK
jgi:hypothetical protein